VSNEGVRRLKVYRDSLALAGELHAAARRWEAFDLWTVGIQLVRAADSVGANTAEADGRRTTPDRLRLLWVARGSLLELQHWIATARERGLPLPTRAEERADELGRMLNGLARSWSRTDPERLTPNA
jgi:four helix bundle protein